VSTAWGPGRHRAAVSLSFDNLGEVTDLARGLWPSDEPLGRHFSVTQALPRIRALLGELGLRATFFVEGRNTELYPDALLGLAADGHEVACHGWCHEPWAQLQRDREATLLERGARALAALGLQPAGFRPPGGRLTASTPALLGELGFTHCSPAGRGAGVHEGILLLPFRWTAVDAYYCLPRFAALRERDRGAADALPPAAHAAALRAALEEAVALGGHVSLLFHPFLLEDAVRFGVLRAVLEEVRALERDGVVWCATHRDAAAWVREAGAPEAPALDMTPA
jgi:peptidoglycan/xylan/chitin deacetylase (PgdA/CDA1 family)